MVVSGDRLHVHAEPCGAGGDRAVIGARDEMRHRVETGVDGPEPNAARKTSLSCVDQRVTALAVQLAHAPDVNSEMALGEELGHGHLRQRWCEAVHETAGGHEGATRWGGNTA